ncbi:MAG: hypothetical protein OXC07_06565 [Kistimonas sp.]|nr:hypothetical protein [Kistimonas sp.]
MIPTSSAAYNTLERWRKNYDSTPDQRRRGHQAGVGEEGHPGATVCAAIRSRIPNRAGPLTGPAHAATTDNPGLIRQHISQMQRSGQELCRQVGITDRAVLPTCDAETGPLNLQDLALEVDSLLSAPGSQLVRVHEHLDQIIEMAGKRSPQAAVELMRQFPDLLVESWCAFSRTAQDDELNAFRQFSRSLVLWMKKAQEQLSASQELKSNAGATFGRLQRQIQDHLAALNPDSRPQAPHKAQAPVAPRLADAQHSRLAAPAIKAAVQVPERPLPPEKKPIVDRLLEKLHLQAPELNIAQDRLLSLLRHPVTGDYDMLRPYFPESAIISYLKLQQVRPDLFPDVDFEMAWADKGIKFYTFEEFPKPGSAAFGDWVRDSAEEMEASRAARHALKQWEPKLAPLMPEHGNFRHYLESKLPGQNIIASLCEDELSAYRQSLKKQLYMHLRVFGPAQMNENVLRYIFMDCCETLLMRCDEDYADSKNQYTKYEKQEFDWLRRQQHSYIYTLARNFVSYGDPTTSDTHHDNLHKSGHKFRISLHPHDYEKGWAKVAELLHRNDCPFMLWKSTYPWETLSSTSDTRFSMGGQFTLYCLAPELAPEELPARFQEARIAEALRQIENCLRENGIRPGKRPFTDIPCGSNHPYISYRFDRDKNRKDYEDRIWVGHDRRRDYMNEPLYQTVSWLLGEGDIRKQDA